MKFLEDHDKLISPVTGNNNTSGRESSEAVNKLNLLKRAIQQEKDMAHAYLRNLKKNPTPEELLAKDKEIDNKHKVGLEEAENTVTNLQQKSRERSATASIENEIVLLLRNLDVSYTRYQELVKRRDEEQKRDEKARRDVRKNKNMSSMDVNQALRGIDERFSVLHEVAEGIDADGAEKI